LFSSQPLALPNELWRRLQVWPESRPTYGGGLGVVGSLQAIL